jgi:hypothetical protein
MTTHRTTSDDNTDDVLLYCHVTEAQINDTGESTNGRHSSIKEDTEMTTPDDNSQK